MHDATTPNPIGNAYGLLLAGVCALRLVLADHAPNAADAGLAGAFAALLLLHLAQEHRTQKHRAQKCSPPPGAMVVLGAACLLALFGWQTSSHTDLSWWAIPGWLLPFVAFALVSAQAARARFQIAIAVVVAGSLNNLVAIYQRLVSYPDALARADALALDPATLSMLSALRPVGLSLSPDLCAAIGLATVLASAALLVPSTAKALPKPAQGALALSILLGALALVFCRSAGAFAAGLLAFVLIAWFLRPWKFSRPGQRFWSGQPLWSGQNCFWRGQWTKTAAAKAAFIGFPALVVAIGLGFGFRGWDSLLRSAAERWQNWEIVAKIALAQPGGVGLGRLAPAYLQARSPEANITLYAHNLLMQWWAELGLPGLGFAIVLFIALLFAGLRQWVAISKLEEKEAASKSAQIWWLVAAAALGARLLIDYDGQIGQTATLFAIISALALTTAAPEGPTRPTASPRFFANVMTALGACILILWPLPSLLEREAALTPFSRAASPPARDDQRRLLAFADQHPRDPIVGGLAANLEISALQQCSVAIDCSGLQQKLHQRTEALLALELPGAPIAVVRARLALFEQDRAAASSWIQRALLANPSSESALVLRLQIARAFAPEDLAAATAHVERWTKGKVRQRIFARAGL